MRNSKDLEAKRRQHHVWANYLLRWGNGTNNVHYTSKTGKLSYDSVRGIVVDDYFYKITHLSDENIEVIKYISRRSADFMQKVHMESLDNFITVQRLEEEYRKLDVDDDKINHALHALKCNMLENLHSSYEAGAQAKLSALADGDVEVLNDPESMRELLLFMGHQFARTKTCREAAIRIAMTSEVDEAMSKAMSHAWWFISYMYGMNIGANLYRRLNSSTHALLINGSGKPFITSDQPIVNVYPQISEAGFTEPEKVDFYYPISPGVAFIVCESKRFASGRQSIDVSVADEFNAKIAAQSLKHIIGDSKEAIKPYSKLVGSRYRNAFLGT
ncbi:hypothetical protein ACVWY1_001759 [Pseudomonas sp. TE6288]